MKNEDAISSTMGVMLIVSVAVLGIAIVGTTMMSQQDVQEIPKVDVIPNIDGKGCVLYLCHGGGDPLPAGELQIIVDGEDKTTDFGLASVGDTWGLDETIKMHYDGDAPKSVQIIHTGSGISTLLKTQAVAPPSEEAEVGMDVVDEGTTGESNTGGSEPEEPEDEESEDSGKPLIWIIEPLWNAEFSHNSNEPVPVTAWVNTSLPRDRVDLTLYDFDSINRKPYADTMSAGVLRYGGYYTEYTLAIPHNEIKGMTTGSKEYKLSFTVLAIDVTEDTCNTYTNSSMFKITKN